MVIRIIDLLLRLMFISVFEQFFISTFTLRLLGYYDLVGKENLKKTLAFIFIPATISNFDLIFPVIRAINPILGLVVTLFFCKMLTKKSVAKSILAVMSSFVIFMASEYLCVTYIEYSTGLTIQAIGSSVYLSILTSIPERLIQYTLVFALYRPYIGKHKVLSKDKIDIIGTIMNIKSLRKPAIIVMAVNLLFLLVFGYLFMFEKLLVNLNLFSQFFITTLVVIFPCASIYFIYELAYKLISNNEAYVEVLISDIHEKTSIAMDSALASGDRKTIDAVNNILNSLNLSE